MTFWCIMAMLQNLCEAKRAGAISSYWLECTDPSFGVLIEYAATRARVIETFDEGEPEEEPLAVSRLRKHASTFLSDTDKRYMGRATSRKALQEESEESGEEGDSGEEEDSGADGDPEEELEESSEEGQQDSDSGEQELKALVRKMKSNDLELPKVTDFEKFTEGMDDIGDSDDDDDDDEEEEEEEESEEEPEEEGMEEEEDGAVMVMTFSEEKVGEEVKKGKAVKKQIGDSGEEEEDSGADGDPEEELEESSEEGQQDSDSGEQELKALVRKMKSNDLELPKVTDFEKFTEGMDDIGDSDDDDDEEEESEEESEEEGMEEEEEEDGAVMTFSEEKVGEEVKKGKAVKKQIALWDQLLEGRIKLQKALLTANQLPQPETFPAFKMMGGAEMAGALKNRKWEKPFNPAFTRKDIFHVNDNEAVPVQMMSRTGMFDVFHDKELSTDVLKLPYTGNASLMLLMPQKGMKHLEESWSREHFKKWHRSVERRRWQVILPKFSISATYSLQNVLSEMGITDVFSNSADLSGISEEVKLKVSKIVHKAAIDIDEKGTEAAAGTGVEIMPISMPPTLKFDKPFLLVICNRNTKSILFMGKIANPSEK
ncbi:UNVERIFIED_CONTAM: hypothetical protein FKN15_002599 [Acipenser sinensis]